LLPALTQIVCYNSSTWMLFWGVPLCFGFLSYSGNVLALLTFIQSLMGIWLHVSLVFQSWFINVVSYLSFYLSSCISIYVFAYACVCLSQSLFVYLFLLLSVPSVCPSLISSCVCSYQSMCQFSYQCSCVSLGLYCLQISISYSWYLVSSLFLSYTSLCIFCPCICLPACLSVCLSACLHLIHFLLLWLSLS